ncbi:MAG TPA: hypothetical protein VM687_10400 [Stenotrophomonas sp.]|nr:hypothetical protein [Stenotrophomonas sp.]
MKGRSGGRRPNSGGTRAGAGRKPKDKAPKFNKSHVEFNKPEAYPIQVSAELQALTIEVARAASQLAQAASIGLARADAQAVARLTEATLSRGERLMIAVDLDTSDCLVRLITVSADQRVTQHAAFGQFAPSTTRN